MTAKQHIPTEFPTDKELLNFLQAKTTEGNRWVCRQSTTGRGVRIHEATRAEVSEYNLDAYPTVREAIAAAMGLVNKPLGAGR